MGTTGARRIHAAYRVRPSIGYAVQIVEAGEVVADYSAGNHPHDSATFGARPGVDRSTLHRWARRTARDMLAEHAGTGPVVYDKEIPFGEATR